MGSSDTMTFDLAFPDGLKSARVMIFVDGENLAARYGELLGERQPLKHVAYQKGVFVWSSYLRRIGNPPVPIVRHSYYTSSVGSGEDRDVLHSRLKEVGIEAPHVFPRRKGGRSKRVDISLSVDMLSHAHRRNYDVAVLVAGDEDYVPLVEAVEREGCRVVLWFFDNGLSQALARQADHFFNLEAPLIRDLTDFRRATYL